MARGFHFRVGGAHAQLRILAFSPASFATPMGSAQCETAGETAACTAGDVLRARFAAIQLVARRPDERHWEASIDAEAFDRQGHRAKGNRQRSQSAYFATFITVPSLRLVQ
jgi:hypothetical protein